MTFATKSPGSAGGAVWRAILDREINIVDDFISPRLNNKVWESIQEQLVYRIGDVVSNMLTELVQDQIEDSL